MVCWVGKRKRVRLRTSDPGDGVDIEEYVRWLFAVAFGALLPFTMTFLGFGCLSPIQYSLCALSAPNRTIGATMRTTAMCLLAFMTFPFIACSGLAFGLWSNVAMCISTMVLFTPFIALRQYQDLNPFPVVVVSFGGFVLLANVGADGPRIVKLLYTSLLSGGVAVFANMFSMIVFCPKRALDAARSILSSAMCRLSTSFAQEMSHLLMPTALRDRQYDESADAKPNGVVHVTEGKERVGSSDGGDGGTTLEPLLPQYCTEVTNTEWDQPPHVKPVEAHFASELVMLRTAENLIHSSAWEPQPLLAAKHTEPIDTWLAMVRKLDEIFVTIAVLTSALQYEDVRGCDSVAVDFLFTNERIHSDWIEMCALISSTLARVSEWLLIVERGLMPYDDDDDDEDGGVDNTDEENQHGQPQRRRQHRQRSAPNLALLSSNNVQLQELNAKTFHKLPEVVRDYWKNPASKALAPGAARSLTTIAVTIISLSERTIQLEEMVRDLACERKDKQHNSWRNVGNSQLRWISLAVHVVTTRTKNAWPDLSSPAKVISLLQGWRFRFFLRFFILCSLIIFLDVLLISPQLPLSQTAWVYISAVLVHQPSTEATLMASMLRIVGTIVGCVAAGLVMLSVTLACSPVLISVYLTASTVLFLVAYEFVPLLRKLTIAKFLSILTNYLVVMCQYSSSSPCSAGGNFSYAAVRMLAVSIGVIMSFLFQLLLFPRFAQDDLRQRLSSTLVEQFQVFDFLMNYYRVKVRKSTQYNDLGESEMNVMTATSISVNSEHTRYWSVSSQLQATLEIFKPLHVLREELTEITALLKELPVVTERAWLRSLLFGVSESVRNLQNLQRSLYTSLTSMALLLEKAELISNTMVNEVFLHPLQKQFDDVMRALGHLSKIAAEAIYFKWASSTRLQLLEEAEAMLFSERIQLRRGFVRQSRILRQSLEKELQRAAKSRSLSKEDGSSVLSDRKGEAEGKIGSDFIMFNAIFFVFTTILDSFVKVVDQCKDYGEKELERHARWGF